MKKTAGFTAVRDGAAALSRAFYDRLGLGEAAAVHETKRERGTSPERRVIISAARQLVLSFILSQGAMAFGTYPLGLSVISAAGGGAPILALGAALGTLISGAPKIYLISYIFSLFLRAMLSVWLVGGGGRLGERISRGISAAFSENLYIRVAISVAPAFVLGAYNTVAGGFYLYDLAGMIFLCLAVPVATFIFSGAFDSSARETPFFRVALGALIFASVYSLREISFFGISLGLVAAFFLTVYATTELGLVRGTVVSAAAGLAIGPIYLPIFALAGVVAGSLGSLSPRIASASAAVSASALGSFLVGLSALTSLFPAAAIGSVLFFLADGACILPRFRTSSEKSAPVAALPLAEIKNKSTVARLGELSDSFSAISQIFYNISSATRTPSVSELRAICDSVCDRYCAECSYRAVCWDSEYAGSADMLTSIASELRSRGRASARSVPEHMTMRCREIGAILSEINASAARAIEKKLSCERAETISLDYEAFATLLSEALAGVEREHTLDAVCAERIETALREKDVLKFDSVIAWGEREKEVRICGVPKASLACSTSALKSRIEGAVGASISTPVLELDGAGISVAFRLLPAWSCEYSHSLSSAAGEECGDAAVFFDGRYSYSYSLIADGMGSGSSAALISRLSSVYLERLLSVGIGAEKAIKILNSLIRGAGIECSSTIDLAELDLALGKLSFYKSGAAPSYVLRDGKLFMLSSKSMPIGIIRAVHAEMIGFELSDGDVIIMLSDGVCEDFDECAWLPQMLTEEWEDDISAMADKLVREATVRTAKKDDISVGIVRVRKA